MSWPHPNTHPICELLEHAQGVDLQIQSNRISSTHDNNGTSKRSPREGPELIVKQKPGALNQTNNTTHGNDHLSAKTYTLKGKLVSHTKCFRAKMFGWLVLLLNFVLGGLSRAGMEARGQGEGGGCMLWKKGRNT